MNRKRAAKAEAGPSQQLELTRQQRQEKLEQLADILLNIYGELSPEQQAILSQSEQKAV